MLKDYNKPKRNWTDKEWINYCQIMIHNPWINAEEREYYRDKLKDLTNTN